MSIIDKINYLLNPYDNFLTIINSIFNSFFPYIANLIRKIKFEYIINVSLIITFFGLISTWVKNWNDTKYKRSEFYLKEAKDYFNEAINLLLNDKNNHVKWHNAIFLLKRAVEVAVQITIEEHKKIYIAKYIDATYKIGNIANNIDSFKFFYGYDDYIKIKAEDLYKKNKFTSCSSMLNEHPKDDKTYENKYRISIEGLSFLCRFLHRSNEFHNHQYNERWDSSFGFSILTKKINNAILCSDEISRYSLIYPQIIDYLIDYQLFEREKMIVF